MEEPIVKDELLKGTSEEKLETVSGGVISSPYPQRGVCRYCGGDVVGGIYCVDCGQKQ